MNFIDEVNDMIQKSKNEEEKAMFSALIEMLSMKGEELDREMTNFVKRYVCKPLIRVGDECRYIGQNCDQYFIVTKIYGGFDGLRRYTYFFDAIYHDGSVLHDGSLSLIEKTGNYYPIMSILEGSFHQNAITV